MQKALLKALKKAGKPMVLVNFSGSAMALNWSNDNVDAIVQAFYPGEATGTALTKLLYGDINPSGRLPVTFYRNLDGFADFDDYAMQNRTYRYFTGEVLYPFGYGLDYSNVTYTDLQLPKTLNVGEDLSFSVTLNNNSEHTAGQVTQVYLHMPDAPVRVPQTELKGFSHDEVKAGSSTTLNMTIAADTLVYIDDNGAKQPYTGTLEVSVGDGQPQYANADKVQKANITIRR